MQVFLFLNYNTAQEVIKLSEQILALNHTIVIVDNNSKSEDVNLLKKLSATSENIHLICSEENLGYARGNNLGFDYIKKNLPGVKAIHVLNSDIDVSSFAELTRAVEANYKEASVLVPQVLTNGYNSSPMYKRNLKTVISKLQEESKIYSKKIRKHQLARIIKPFYRYYLQKNQSFIQTQDFQIEPLINEDEYYVYNGCYLIFTKSYIDAYNYLFNPKTFLYYEEELLFWRLKQDDKVVKELKGNKIKHLESVGSQVDYVKRYQRLRDSCEICLKEITCNNL